jgi:Flp pilus assembly protein TadD
MRPHLLTPRVCLGLIFSLLIFASAPASAQKPRRPSESATSESSSSSVKVCVRDSRGLPLTAPVMVRLHSVVSNYDVRNPTQDGSTATFPSVKSGDYEVEIHALGFKPTTEPVTLTARAGEITVYIYLASESSDPSQSVPPAGTIMSPKLRAEMDKGLVAMRKQEYEQAKVHFSKAAQMAPGNPNLMYLLGSAELALNHLDLAKAQFESALKLEPTNQRALMALAELHLQAGDLPSAITTLEKAFDVNGADWRVHFLLATAYARSERLPEAEKHAVRAADLAHGSSAGVLYLLGEIQFAEHKTLEARDTWQQLVVNFPADPLVPKTKNKLASTANIPNQLGKDAVDALPVSALPSVVLEPVLERPWAPPDIDSNEYRLADDAVCNLDEILPLAQHRLKSQLNNFEKFTATERIEHQEVDRYGIPGPLRSRQFSYIVFVRPLAGDSVWLDENRLEGNDLSTFPTALATTGLNSMGVSVLQSVAGGSYSYRCEGLTSLRGEAAWQIRFQQKPGTRNSTRQWRKNGQIINLPLKGRLWLAASSYDLLRIESDLAEPVAKLELTRDHLIVDYGPVNFENGNVRLWLPWSAEMFMELHGKRYHHKHYLTDYLLFVVDTNHKIATPETPSTINADSPT